MRTGASGPRLWTGQALLPSTALTALTEVKLKKDKAKTRRDNFAELVRQRIVRKIEPVELSDLVSGFD